MHCDDKRTLFILKENIERSWQILKESNYDEEKLENFKDELIQYFELKQSLQ